MVHERWSPQWDQDLNPRPSSHESSAFTTRPWLLTYAINLCFLNQIQKKLAVIFSKSISMVFSSDFLFQKVKILQKN
jgi:hypothetical protein